MNLKKLASWEACQPASPFHIFCKFFGGLSAPLPDRPPFQQAESTVSAVSRALALGLSEKV